MERLSANFYPAQESKRFEGKPYIDPETGASRESQGGWYVGKANITIANAYKLNDISVFQMDDGSHSLRFPDFPARDRETGEMTRASFVVPKSSEAYAAMIDIVVAARESDQGFAFTKGTYNPQVTIHGNLADEDYADGRYSAEIGDICIVRGLATRRAEYEANGEKQSFIAVDIPNTLDAEDRPSTYEKDGQTCYNKVLTPLVSTWTNQESGEKRSKDYGRLLNRLILSERKNLREAVRNEKDSLDKTLHDAKARSHEHNRKTPEKELEMSM